MPEKELASPFPLNVQFTSFEILHLPLQLKLFKCKNYAKFHMVPFSSMVCVYIYMCVCVIYVKYITYLP